MMVVVVVVVAAVLVLVRGLSSISIIFQYQVSFMVAL
jgi:hypothetical protein